ncbi:MAG: PAS domain S-box protein [Candidatus Heimdallarchaeota archaeon]
MSKIIEILHLEDNQIDAELVKEILSLEDNFNFSIKHVDNQEDFIDAIENETYDLILADYSLPSFDGLSALKLIRNKEMTIPFILVSAVLGEELAIEALHSGATDYVLKSRLERLVPAIQRAFREIEERDQKLQLQKTISELQEIYQKVAERVRGFLKMDLPSGKFSIVDKFIEELSGYPAKDWYGIPNFIQKIIHPDYLEYYNENFKRLQKGFVPKMLEYKINRQDGEERWWLQFNIGSFDIEQKLVSIAIVIIDNTEAKDSNLKYQNLFENALVGMFRTLVETGEFIEANENMAKIFGFASATALKTSTAVQFYSDTEARDELLRILKTDGKVQDYQLKLKKIDGSDVYVSLSSQIFPKEGYIEGVMVDVTDRIKAQEELMQREKEIEKIFEHSSTATLMVEEDMTISRCNQQTVLMSGYTKEEIEGKLKWDELIHPDDLDKMIAYHRMRREEASGPPRSYEFRFIDKTRNVIPSVVTVGMIPNTKRSVASVLNISQRKKAEESLMRDRRAFQILAEAATKATDIPDLCNRVLVGLMETLDFEFGTIRLLKLEENILELVAVSGLTENERNLFKSIPLDDSERVSAAVARTKKAVFAPNLDESEFFKERDYDFLIDDIQAFISWPILNSKQELIGTLQLISRQVKIFSEQDEIFFENIAGMFATTLERKIADEELRQIEKQRLFLANIVENSKEVVIRGDRLGIIFYANSPIEEVLGYAPEEIIGQHMSILAPSGGEAKQKEIFQRVMESGKETFETVRRHKNGHLIPVIMTVSSTKDDNSNILSVNSIIVDISNIKKLEESLKDRSYELEVMNKVISAGFQARNITELMDIVLSTVLNSLDFSGGAMFIVDEEAKVANLIRSLGMSSQFTESAQTLPILSNPFKKLFNDGQSIFVTDYMGKSEGHMSFGLNVLIAVPFFSQQKVIGCLVLGSKEKREIEPEDMAILEAMGREIGIAIAKLKAEEELLISEENLKKIFDVLEGSFIIFDHDSGKILKLNETLQMKLGYNKMEFSKMIFFDLVHESQKAELELHFERLKQEPLKGKTIMMKLKTLNVVDIQLDFYYIKFTNQEVIMGINRSD